MFAEKAQDFLYALTILKKLRKRACVFCFFEYNIVI